MRMLRRDLNDRMVSQTSEMLENGSHVEGAVALLRVTQLAASNFFLGSFSFFFFNLGLGACGRPEAEQMQQLGPSVGGFFLFYLVEQRQPLERKKPQGDGSAATGLFRPFSGCRMGNDSARVNAARVFACILVDVVARPATCGQVQGNEGRPQQSNQTGGTG